MRKLSMPAGALFCPDLSMRIHTWSLPEIVSTTLSGEGAAKPTIKSPRRVAGFGQPWKKRAPPAAKPFSIKHRHTRNGFCAVERQPSKQNLGTDSGSKTN